MSHPRAYLYKINVNWIKGHYCLLSYICDNDNEWFVILIEE